ncbi:purine-nucleoside phosphorylase [Candidatus Sumerlaeota bacterium]|nr:purine-nucleoside phosphorylase [Candidatus Sumerlaeota bacterium]
MFDLKAYSQQIEEAAALIRSRQPRAPDVGVICGTGMGQLGEKVSSAARTGPVVVPYDEIPHFPVSTVESHHGNLLLGELAGRSVLLMQGRFHFYEGYSMREVTFPVRVMKALGCKAMIVMNATGSTNRLIPKGSLVLITDHINLMGDNPLIGPNDEAMGPRFPDMSQPYDRRLIRIGEEVALSAGLKVHQGVMAAVTGPNLETAAEYRMFQFLGADLVTMSTVPEVIVARHASLAVLGLSVVTDECLPDSLAPANVDEIIAVAAAAAPRIETLIRGILQRIGEVID